MTTEGKKGRLMIVADAAAATGFAQVSHNLIMHLYKEWDIHVLAINYMGDPHPITEYAKLYNPASKVHGDSYGYSRIASLQKELKPDVVLHINDPWILSNYIHLTNGLPGKQVFYTPIDGKNVKEAFVLPLNNFDAGISYTEFGAEQLKAGGYIGELSVIPHGVDTTVFYPIDKREARAIAAPPEVDTESLYIVQVVDRNSLRKRIDLAMYGFAEWVKRTNKPKNVLFYYHGAFRDVGYDIGQLAKYYGIADRLAATSTQIDPAIGIDIDKMKYIYSLANVKVSMSGGEGWGLTTMESMACGIPNIVIDAAAYAEWPRGGVEYINPMPHLPFTTVEGGNVQHAQPNMEEYIDALERLYNDKVYRETLGQAGREIVTQDKFKWSTIAKQFDVVFTEVIGNTNDNSNGESTNTFTW